MFGPREDEDGGDLCKHCGYLNPIEVGFILYCAECGEPLGDEPCVPVDHLDDDVLLDARYVTFDSVLAFRILRDLGRLDECT